MPSTFSRITTQAQALRKKTMERLCGVTLHGDLQERYVDWNLSLPLGKKREERLRIIRDTGVLFIHVPKNAGSAITQDLYGCRMRHESIRYYLRHAPDLVYTLPSFALWRDPVERFLSAYDFIRNGGGSEIRLHPDFVKHYADLTTLDRMIEFVAGASSIYKLDHVLRPQTWYLTDRQGNFAIQMLFDMKDINHLHALVPGLRQGNVRRFNTTQRFTTQIPQSQKDKIISLYKDDYQLQAYIKPVHAYSATARPVLPTHNAAALSADIQSTGAFVIPTEPALAFSAALSANTIAAQR